MKRDEFPRKEINNQPMETSRIPNRQALRIGEKKFPLPGIDASQIMASRPSAKEIKAMALAFLGIGKFYFICRVRSFL